MLGRVTREGLPENMTYEWRPKRKLEHKTWRHPKENISNTDKSMCKGSEAEVYMVYYRTQGSQ